MITGQALWSNEEFPYAEKSVVIATECRYSYNMQPKIWKVIINISHLFSHYSEQLHIRIILKKKEVAATV